MKKAWFLIGLIVLPWWIAAPPTEVCVEDMRCWNCAEMGNRICGPDVDFPLEDIEPNTGGFN